ncbi:DegT/DnrJ/EryC1/StrS family aminotransferase [Streptomyces collinus]|uniref:DegT/DnrJ/EryC1/StrS family aminotransferase n=1 Tax=Streptomyces collinus TaxID=42684 RepID=UPI003683538E
MPGGDGRCHPPGTWAVIPVHLHGHKADMPAVNSVARAHGLTVIEDCAQAPDASLDGRAASTWGGLRRRPHHHPPNERPICASSPTCDATPATAIRGDGAPAPPARSAVSAEPCQCACARRPVGSTAARLARWAVCPARMTRKMDEGSRSV